MMTAARSIPAYAWAEAQAELPCSRPSRRAASASNRSNALIAMVCIPVLWGMHSVESHAADAAFQWDYPQSGASGFALYCGTTSTRSYSTRIDVGNVLSFALPLSEEPVHFCAVRAYDAAREESTFSNEVAVSLDKDTGAAALLPPINVSAQGSVTPTATGFRAKFSLPFDSRQLNLFGSQDGREAAADVTLVGATSGAVAGSLVLDADNQGFTFLKTGGVLAPDTYTLTIASRYDSFVDLFGRPLDGNGDGRSGDDYLFGDDYRLVFVVGPSNSPVLSIGEFARGPGQAVNLPASDSTAGIPVRISNGSSVRDVDFTLGYDPTLLSVLDVGLANASGTLTLKSIDEVAGLIHVHVANVTGLTDASTVLLRLQAQVPADAPYRSRHMLDLRDLKFNDGALTGRTDDGLQVVAYLGDTDADGKYSSFDALLIQRVSLRLDSGFSAFPLIDPIVLSDTNGNGRLESSDVLTMQLKVLRRAVPELPDF